MSTKSFHIHLSQVRWTIITAYFIAFILDTMMLLGYSTPILPPLTLLVLLYWSANFIDRTHLFTALLLGVLADTLYQTTLGAHALIYIILTFLMIRHRLRFRTYPLWQQAFSISLYMLVYQSLNYLFFSPVLDNSDFVPYWSMPAIGLIAWPFLSYFLGKFSHTAAHS
ncbi:MAG: rod shape-determining protein MreD [Thiomicrorhabdus sp.]|nr:MAG: rod shape-determining protein MreD [Thiomicrorhabdus sp.]